MSLSGAVQLANGCYHWLASRLHGFANAKPKSVYRKFVETSGAIEIERALENVPSPHFSPRCDSGGFSGSVAWWRGVFDWLIGGRGLDECREP